MKTSWYLLTNTCKYRYRYVHRKPFLLRCPLTVNYILPPSPNPYKKKNGTRYFVLGSQRVMKIKLLEKTFSLTSFFIPQTTKIEIMDRIQTRKPPRTPKRGRESTLGIRPQTGNTNNTHIQMEFNSLCKGIVSSYCKKLQLKRQDEDKTVQ